MEAGVLRDSLHGLVRIIAQVERGFQRVPPG